MNLRHALLCIGGIVCLLLAQCLSVQSSPAAERKGDGRVSSRPYRGLALNMPAGRDNPDVITSISNRTVVVGEVVAFRCRAYGVPKPRIKWRKDGVTVTQSHHVRVRHTALGSRLRIRNAQLRDAGHYQCLAKNSHGTKLSAKAYLNVRETGKMSKSGCEVYTGSLCELTSFVHILPGRDQHQTEYKLRQTHNTLLHTYALSHSCRKHLLPYLCRLHFPACSARASNPPRRVCREDCLSLQVKWCRRELKISRAFRVQLRKIVTCGDLPAAGKGHKPSGCVHVFERRKPKQTPLQSNPPSTCMQYTGSVCKSFYEPGQLIAMDSRRVASLEHDLLRTLTRLDGYISPKCGKHLTKALCYHLFPPCTKNAIQRPIYICKAQCEILKGSVCSKEFRFAGLFQEDSHVLPTCERLTNNKNGHGPCLDLGFALRVNKSRLVSGANGFGRCSSFLMRARKNNAMFPMVHPIVNNSYSCGRASKSVFTAAAGIAFPIGVQRLLSHVQSDINKGHVSLSRSQDGTIRYCIRARMVLGSLVQGWSPYRTSSLLPRMVRPPDSTLVPGLEVTQSRGEIAILVPLGSAAVYHAHAKIDLHDVKFYYKQTLANGSLDGSFIARGTFKLCETVFVVEVTRTKKGPLRITGNSSSPLDIDSIERVFGVAMPSSMLFKAIKRSELLVMRLMKPSIDAHVDKHVSVRFAGLSYMYIYRDARPINLEFYAGRHHQSNLFVAGLTSKQLTFNEALETFTGLNLPYLDFIESFTDSTVGVLVSTSAISPSFHPRIQLSTKPLSTALVGSLPRGLTIVSRSKLPSACDSSRLCQLLLVVFGRGSRFTTTMSANQDRVSINVALDKVSQDALVAYESAEITLKVMYGNMTLLDVLPYLTFNVHGNIRVSHNPLKSLQFVGQLEYDGISSRLGGKFSSAHEWRDAFGVTFLTVKNLSVRFSAPTDTMSSQVDATVTTDAVFEFGVGCQNHHKDRTSCISGYAHLGLSENVAEHFFYGKVQSLTLQQLLRACNIQIRLPAALGDIGFPEGLTVSVAKVPQDLRPEGGPLVQSGLSLVGRMSVLGVESDASVTLLPNEFVIDSDVTGDDIVGVDDATPLKTFDRRYGPKLYLKTRIDPTPFLQAHIDGYARIFGVFDEIRVLVTREGTQIKMVADLHKSIKAYLYMSSNYSRHINATHLQARIIFRNGLSKLTRLASKHVVFMLEKEKSQLKNAEGEAKRRLKPCLKTAKRVCGACLDRPNCRAIVATCSREQPHNSGRSLQTLCQRALFDGCHDSNGTCKMICDVIGVKLNGSCKAYRDAARTLQDLERSLKWVKQAQLFITGSIFQIHGISFEAHATLHNLMNVHVDTTFDCTIFGQRHRLKGLKLRLDAFTHLASEVARYAVTWYGNKNHSRYYGNRPKKSFQ
ncbi:uncharacterized protein LOC5517169 [Nematostella vectensis]|uniref:uncharacterized protein LOC5517169 n=1 Tax=Nematostella vectensis TaxID=45351 RepID=UPI002076E168|nr:uncharacterized protein LOC5517169 [Nematostella vectensis]